MRLVSIMFVAAACGGPPEQIAKDPEQQVAPTKSLYARLGGTPGITAVGFRA